MADAADLKSVDRKVMWVRLPPWVPTLTYHNMDIQIRLERDDTIPAFAGFLRCEPPSDKNHIILMNVAGIMSPVYDDGSGGEILVNRDDRIRIVISTIMHEFGHVLESHFNLQVNEEAIEKTCEEWESLFERLDNSNG